MIEQKLQQIVESAIDGAVKDGKLGSLTERSVPVVIERPRLPEHGDLACGVAMKLAGQAKTAPIKIAESISEYIKSNPEANSDAISKCNVAAPGFINFQLGKRWLANALQQIHESGADFGRSDVGGKKRLLIEYVSANPTGELHIGHGRNAVFGSCLANLFKFAGYDVVQEFYLNDTGAQIEQLGAQAWALYQRKNGREVEYPEGGYPEESISHFVDQVFEQNKDKFINLNYEEGVAALADATKHVILEDQKQLLEKLGIHFDSWFSEATLHNGQVEEVLEIFARNNFSYEAEGALWLKSKELGDERDRVLRKSAGNTTYLAADAAYHRDKYSRNFDGFVTIWGADHHGQVPGLRAAVKALGEDPDLMEIILTQIVNLSRDGKSVRMSKRRGTVVTLSEVMEEVGKDAVRYYLAESSPQNPIAFDLELAKKTSRENPAFYIQYAHARCCAILRRALEPYVNTEKQVTEPPVLSEKEWADFQAEFKKSADVFLPAFDSDPIVFADQKALVMALQSFPQEVRDAAVNRQPGRLARYAFEVANALQKFYEVSRVITDDTAVTKARLGLIMATKQVLANVLGIIGVSAPERM
ncbi:MAG: arginine--tRNA ligase [Cyanobacteria bacterium SZAS LIN-5]|nr:arginine--tRNA ligase [Cyanobacteria bacterium SZAS LIN-5]RTL44094.1 MAG: arginine--tRNA ligase [Candidatus Melainabacteria bacterium]